jgi:hypothetical protein
MSERSDRVTVVETGGSGGGAVIIGMMIAALILLGLFFLLAIGSTPAGPGISMST